MSLELALYIIFFLMTAYILTSMRIEKIFKKGRVLEARLTVIVLGMCVSYLATNFVINFLEVSRIM